MLLLKDWNCLHAPQTFRTGRKSFSELLHVDSRDTSLSTSRLSPQLASCTRQPFSGHTHCSTPSSRCPTLSPTPKDVVEVSDIAIVVPVADEAVESTEETDTAAAAGSDDELPAVENIDVSAEKSAPLVTAEAPVAVVGVVDVEPAVEVEPGANRVYYCCRFVKMEYRLGFRLLLWIVQRARSISGVAILSPALGFCCSNPAVR